MSDHITGSPDNLVPQPPARPELPWHGSCQCGEIEITLTAYPLTLYACHCLECQKASAAAFGLSMRVSYEAVTVAGKTHIWKRDAETPREVHCHICPQCGCRIMHQRPNAPDVCNIKPGILSETHHLQVAGHIWASRKQSHVVLQEGLPVYDKQPENYQPLIEKYKSFYQDIKRG